MKVIFLDIDGVLWTVGWSIYCNRTNEAKCYEQWDPMQTSNLQWILDETKKKNIDVKIVISSTWRLGRTIEELKEIAKKSGLDPESIIDKTPAIYYKTPKKYWWRQHWGPWYKRIIPHRSTRTQAPRGEEIQHWMTQHNVKAENIVIIDDDSDMVHLKKQLVKTCSYDGLGFKKASEVLRMLGVDRK